MSFAKESSRFYDPRTGQAVNEIIGVNGKMREPTIRDARLRGLKPAVSKIIRAAAAPGLERWKQEQVLHASVTLPRNAGESLDDFIKRVRVDSQEQTRKASERGKELHGAIQAFAEKGFVNPKFSKHIDALIEQFIPLGIDLTQGTSERSFCCEHYGGTPDWRSDLVLLDYKTKDEITPELVAYDEQGMQLVAYDEGIGGAQRDLYNVFIGANDAQVHLHRWKPEERPRLSAMFKALLFFVKARDGI